MADKDTAKNLKKARKWCEEARDLLKIKRKWKKDLDTFESEEMMRMLVLVEGSLGRLEKVDNVKHKELAQKFRDLAESGHTASKENNADLAKSLTGRLALLDIEIRAAAGEIPPEVVNKAKENGEKRGVGEYQIALKNAEGVQKELALLGNGVHQFVGNINSYITNAKSFAEKKPADYPKAMQQLGMVANEKTRMDEVYRQYGKYQEDLAAAQKQEKLLKDSEFVSGIKGVAGPVTKIIADAVSLADNKFDYPGARAKLKEVDGAYETAIKNLPKEAGADIEEMVKLRSAFDKRYVEEQTKINHARKLRGAEVDPMKGLLDDAETILQDARQMIDRTKIVSTAETALEELDKIDELVEDAKKSSGESKEESEANLKAMWLYEKTLPRAERAYEEMKRFPGTEEEQKKMFLMIGKAKTSIVVDKVTGLKSGYAEGAKALEGYEKVIEAARERFAKIVAEKLPQGVVDAAQQVYKSLHQLAGIAPEFEIDVRYRDMQDLGAKIRNDLGLAKSEDERLKVEVAAIKEVVALADELNDHFDKLHKSMQNFESGRGTWKKERQRVLDLGMPEEVLIECDRQARIGIEVDAVDHEWERAHTKLLTALDLLKELEAQHGPHIKNWQEIEKKLADLRMLGLELTKWPPLMSQARTLLDEVFALQAQFKKTYDFAECIKTFNDQKLDEMGRKLAEAAEDAPRGKELEEFMEVLRQANEEIQAKIYRVRTDELRKLEQAFKTLGEPSVTTYHADVTKIEKEWDEFFRKPHPSAGEVKKQHKDFVKRIQDEIDKINKLLKDPTALSNKETELKTAEDKRAEGKLPETIAELIKQYASYGADGTKARNLLKMLQDKQANNGGDQTAGLKLLKDNLINALQVKRAKAYEQAQKIAKAGAETELKLKKLKTTHKNFKAYHKQLETQLNDVKAMLGSGDPEMLAVAERSLNEIQLRASEIDPKDGGDEAVRYSAVENKWKELSHLVGDGNLKNRLPNTYSRLKSELDEAISKAKKSSPKDGLAILEKLDKPLRDAVAEAKKNDDEQQRYKQRKSNFQDSWVQAKKDTRTRFTEKTDSVESWIEERLAEAEGLRHTENGLPKAYELLAKLEKAVNDIVNSDDPRDALQKLDASLAQEQRLMRDMAREFKNELGVFKDKLIPETKEVVKQREKDGLIRKADMEDTIKMVDGLTKVADSASKIVKPYLLNLDTVGKGKQKAPNIDKVREDFKTARKILDEGRRTAGRLAGQTMTTNVNIIEDLKKVEKNWADQVKLFSASIRSAVSSLEAAVKELEKDGTLTDGIRANAEQAVKIIDRVEGHFSMSAFNKPFAVMSAGKNSSKEDKKAAREDALRVMRQYRTDVLNHPVLTKLTKKENPFEQAKLTAAMGYLRAALKRIEIESLIGV
jgi:hypothetical protein